MASDRKQPAPTAPHRRQRSNYKGQEAMCDALWEFAREAERSVKAGETFERDKNGWSHPTVRQLTAISQAMERIATGFGYRLLNID